MFLFIGKNIYVKENIRIIFFSSEKLDVMLKGEEARAAIQIHTGSHGVIINASKSHIMPIFAQWHREIYPNFSE